MLIFVLGPWQSHGQSPAAEPVTGAPSPGLHLLESNNEAITLELRLPDGWQVSAQKASEFELAEINVPGFSHTSDPGTPRLPVKFVTLGIPWIATPRVQVLEADGPRIETGYRLAANPSPSLSFDPTTAPSLAALNGPPAPKLEPATGDDFYPAELVQVVEVGRLRSQQFVQLRLNPFQYHPGKQILRVYPRLRVVVKFDTTAPPVKGKPIDEGPFEPALRSLLLNYAQARMWRMPQSALPQVEPLSFYSGKRFRIEVSREGLYQLTRTMLFVSGQTSQIYDHPLSTFQLFEDFNLTPESEVALEIVDKDGDNYLDYEDIVRFYGRGPDAAESRYTGTRVYWLVAGRATGRRMSTRIASPGSGTIAPDFPSTVHIEENHQYWSDLPDLGGSDTHWYWEYLSHADPNSPLERDFTVSTPGRSSATHDVAVRAKLVGYSSNPDVNPDHWTKLYVNSHLVTSVLWDGQVGMVVQGNTTSSDLSTGANTVQVRMDLLPGIAADALLVDWFEIDYRRSFEAQSDRLFFTRPAGYTQYQITGFSSSAIGLYDITDARNPVRLLGTRASPLPGTSWALRFGDATPSAERYIAVVLQEPAILNPDKVQQVDAGDDLKALSNGADYLIITHADFTDAANRLAGYRAGDFTTKVIQVQDVYDQFGNGVLDPEAIHDFLVYAVANWSPGPRYVLLMGDGSYDYRNYLGSSPPNYIPPYQAMVDPWLGETADENYYAAVVGPDIMPDLYVGRLPVDTLDQANAIVDKIIAYEARSGVQTQRSALGSALFVADDYDPTRNAGNFPQLADTIANDTLPDSYTVQKVYYRVTHSTVSSVRSAVINNINQGQQFVEYVGHSSIGQWGDLKGFVRNSDVGSLSNAGQFPVVLGMTCLEGSFQDVAQDAVAEDMVRAANKGAVASWSATGLGVATGHDALNRGFYNALFQNGVRRLGPATVGGKIRLYQNGTNLDLIHTFALLGDPATDTGIQAVCTSSQADITGDGKVDVNDLAALAPYWHKSKGTPYDQDGNNYINVVDFMQITVAWDQSCGG